MLGMKRWTKKFMVGAFVGGCWFTLAHQQHCTPWPHKLAIDLKLGGPQIFVVRMRIWGFLVMVLTRTTPTKGSVRGRIERWSPPPLQAIWRMIQNDSNFHMTKVSTYIRNDVSRICQSNHNLIHMNGHHEPSTPCKMDGVWLEYT
jgi:hypothetical protein